MGVVDDQEVGGAQLRLELGGGFLLQRLDEGRQETFGGHVDHPPVRPGLGSLRRQGVQQVGLPEAVGGVEQHRIEVTVRPGRHPARHGMGELVGGAGDEGVEGEALLQTGGPGQTAGLGKVRRRERAGLDRRAPVDGGEPDARAAAGGFHLVLGLQVQAATGRVVLGPHLCDPPPGVAPDPVRRDAGRRDQHQGAAGLFQQGGLGHPRPEGRIAELALERRAGPHPNLPGRGWPRLACNFYLCHLAPIPNMALPSTARPPGPVVQKGRRQSRKEAPPVRAFAAVFRP